MSRSTDNLQPVHDESTFERVFDELARGETATLDSHFAGRGLPLPRVVWNPDNEVLPDASLRATHAHWSAMRKDRAMPDWRDLRAEELGVDVVNLAVVDPVPGTLDYRFALYGSAVAGAAKRDYRGETVREMALRTGTPGPLLYRAVYAMVQKTGLPAFTWNVAPPWQAVAGWNRIVLPFAADDAAIRFLVCLKSEGTRTVAAAAQRDGEMRLEFNPDALR
jgi:hypothetical protein